MSFWNSLARRYLAGANRPSGKPGARAYAIGDVHGRLDLLEDLLARIEDDHSAAGEVDQAFLVFLGDLIDRGPHSREVVDLVRRLELPGMRKIVLGGNHESVMLDVLNAKPGLVYEWLKYGGSECAESYGLHPARLRRSSEEIAAKELRERVPSEHIRFLESMGDTFQFGDYLFVHAGIRPGVALADQSRRDLRWIRGPFLEDNTNHGMVIVHGHTVSDGVDERANRIGIDTGAVYNGCLTALVIEGESRRYITTSGDTLKPRSWQPLADQHVL